MESGEVVGRAEARARRAQSWRSQKRISCGEYGHVFVLGIVSSRYEYKE